MVPPPKERRTRLGAKRLVEGSAGGHHSSPVRSRFAHTVDPAEGTPARCDERAVTGSQGPWHAKALALHTVEHPRAPLGLLDVIDRLEHRIANLNTAALTTGQRDRIARQPERLQHGAIRRSIRGSKICHARHPSPPAPV
ncbi:hypothetical protein ABH926_007599 [Catenulispora sp. GP43]|uniref:hypothetical protein n=1 Tax=Catenulispora sp. GP43 TaxID=3156263 RepID=UPI003512F9FA